MNRWIPVLLLLPVLSGLLGAEDPPVPLAELVQEAEALATAARGGYAEAQGMPASLERNERLVLRAA